MGNGSAAAATGTIESTLAQIAGLVETRPDLALTQAQALLARTGGLPQAELLACQALRHLGQPKDALPRLAALGRTYPRIPAIGWELAQAAEAAGDTAQAIAALEALTRQQPSVAGGWLLLARLLRTVGRETEAWRADLSGIHASSRDRDLLEAAIAMNEGRLDDAEASLVTRLDRLPDDAAASRRLGEVNWRRGDMSQALALVERAVTLAPGFDLALDQGVIGGRIDGAVLEGRDKGGEDAVEALMKVLHGHVPL